MCLSIMFEADNKAQKVKEKKNRNKQTNKHEFL